MRVHSACIWLMTSWLAWSPATATAAVPDPTTANAIINDTQNIFDWFAKEPNRQLVERLKAARVKTAIEREAHPSGAQHLAGLTFVITGTLPSLSRDQAKDLIKANGGKVTDSVSKNTSYLVLGVIPLLPSLR